LIFIFHSENLLADTITWLRNRQNHPCQRNEKPKRIARNIINNGSHFSKRKTTENINYGSFINPWHIFSPTIVNEWINLTSLLITMVSFLGFLLSLLVCVSFQIFLWQMDAVLNYVRRHEFVPSAIIRNQKIHVQQFARVIFNIEQFRLGRKWIEIRWIFINSVIFYNLLKLTLSLLPTWDKDMTSKIIIFDIINHLFRSDACRFSSVRYNRLCIR